MKKRRKQDGVRGVPTTNVTSPSASPAVYVLPSGASTRTPLYAHQQIGVPTLIEHGTQVGYFALLDDCGLGKTVQIIYALSELAAARTIERTVIVCKTDLIDNWKEELAKHAPHLKVQVLHGVQARKNTQALSLRRLRNDVQVYLINYELFGIPPQSSKLKVRSAFTGSKLSITVDAARILKLLLSMPCACVLDESHKIRGVTARSTETLCSIARAARVRYIATATLEAEKPLDVWAQIFFLDGGRLLGRSYRAFVAKYTLTRMRQVYIRRYSKSQQRYVGVPVMKSEPAGYRNVKELREAIASISLRRKLEECVDMPPLIPMPPRIVSAKGKHLAMMSALQRLLLRSVLKCDGETLRIAPNSSLARLIQMTQRAAAMPRFIDSKMTGHGVKYEALLDILEGHTEQAVVWCYHRDVAQLLAATLNADGAGSLKAACVVGAMRQSDKTEQIEMFKSGKARILTCTGSALQEGHNFQMATHSVIFQPSWSRLLLAQGIKRLWRIGQTRRVVVETIVMQQSLDSYIMDTVAQNERAAQYDSAGGNFILLEKQNFTQAIREW